MNGIQELTVDETEAVGGGWVWVLVRVIGGTVVGRYIYDVATGEREVPDGGPLPAPPGGSH